MANKYAVNTARDSLRAAIAKLGGISAEEARARGFDRADIRANPFGYGSLRVFTRTGDSFDGMAGRLSQYGYPVQDEGGSYCPNVLEQRLRDCIALDSDAIYTPDGYLATAERAALAEYREAEKARVSPFPTRFFSVCARFKGRVVCRVTKQGAVWAWRAPSKGDRPSPCALFLPAQSERLARQFALAATAAGLPAIIKPGRACACYRSGPLAELAPAMAVKIRLPDGMKSSQALAQVRAAWDAAQRK